MAEKATEPVPLRLAPEDRAADAGPLRWALYVDMDAFYVNCEVLDRPELAGTPVIVGFAPRERPSRSVVLSASYEARAFGVHSAQPVAEAARRCPTATWVAPDSAKYERRSGEVVAWLRARFGVVHPQSIDEAVVHVEGPDASAIEGIARAAQGALRAELGLPSSWGVAPHRLIAKIASDRAKPAGVVVVPAGQVSAFLAPLSVEAIPGVGPKTAERLIEAGITTIGELAARRRTELRAVLGPWGGSLVEIARGHLPPEPIDTETGPRSRSTDRTFDEDVGDPDVLGAAIEELGRDLAESLVRSGYDFGSVGVAIKWADFERVQRVRVLPGATDSAAMLIDSAGRLFRELWSEEQRGRHRRARTVTVRTERLRPRRAHQVVLDQFPATSSGAGESPGSGASDKESNDLARPRGRRTRTLDG